MRKLMIQFSVLVSLAFPICFSGCSSSTPMPGSSSPSSEEADAAGGMNKTEGDAPAAEPGKAAEDAGKASSAEEGKAPAAEDAKPAEPKEEGKDKTEG
jgi:hypothetical protein